MRTTLGSGPPYLCGGPRVADPTTVTKQLRTNRRQPLFIQKGAQTFLSVTFEHLHLNLKGRQECLPSVQTVFFELIKDPMKVRSMNRTILICLTLLAVVIAISSPCLLAEDTSKKPSTPQKTTEFRVGFGERDITPPPGLPLWGYGARHDELALGKLDSLFAKAIVIQAGKDKVAFVGLDLGRGPTRAMMTKIRKTISEKAGIEHVLISGSHTHHGPCIELVNKKGFGKGKFDAAVAYNEKLPGLIIKAILEADASAIPARLGVAKKDVPFNRNRHTKRKPKAIDPMLAVLRFDDKQGKPIAILVNFAAHPVMTEEALLKYSADYPGFLQRKVEADLHTKCVFMQGAAGDLSPNPTKNFRHVKAFGEELAGHVIEMAKSIETSQPKKTSVKGKVDRFLFTSRIDFSNPLVVYMFQKAFFPELIQCFVDEVKDGVPAELNTVLLNGKIAFVSGSGEFFCNHANRLKQRSYVDHTFFFGYCNGHNLYFPTIEATSEGGYGASLSISPVELGAGEHMMDKALINIYTMAGCYETLESFLGKSKKKSKEPLSP